MDIESTGEEQELVIAISCSLIWEWNTRAAEKLEGVSKKQLRRGMATSSSVCTDSLLSQASQLNLYPKIATYFGIFSFFPRRTSAHHPQAPPFPLSLPPAYLLCQHRCHQPPRDATHLQVGGSTVDGASHKAELCLGGSKPASRDAGLL